MLMLSLLILAAIATCTVVGAVALTGTMLKLITVAVVAGVVAGAVLATAAEELEPCR